MAAFSSLRWNAGAQRYYFPKGSPNAGQFLKPKAVRDAIEDDIFKQETRGQELADSIKETARKYAKGEIDEREWRAAVAQWREGMAEAVVNTHLNYASAAHGGWAQLDNDAYARTSDTLKFHLQKLDNFAQEIASDPQIVLGNAKGRMDFGRRQDMYFETALFTYEQERTEAHLKAGFTRQRNVPHSEEPCQSKGATTGCSEITALGWQPIGSYPPVGQRTCGPEDLCSSEYDKEPVNRAEAIPPAWTPQFIHPAYAL